MAGTAQHSLIVSTRYLRRRGADCHACDAVALGAQDLLCALRVRQRLRQHVEHLVVALLYGSLDQVAVRVRVHGYGQVLWLMVARGADGTGAGLS